MRRGSAMSAAGHRRQEAYLIGRGDGRVESGQVANVLPVDVHVDEPVQVTVVGQELATERGMPLDQAVDDGSDRVTFHLERLDAADTAAEHRWDEHRAHARASGDTVPASPVVVMRNGASAPTFASASGRPALRASTAASEQTGQAGSR